MPTVASTIFARLDALSINAPAALGVSRQTYSIARKRGQMSDSMAVRAAALLGDDPAALLLQLRADSATDPDVTAAYKRAYLYYVKSVVRKKTINDTAGMDKSADILHFPRSKKMVRAERLCQWLLSVPKMSPLSPTRRLDYYIRGWNVLAKIDHFVESGQFDEAVANRPAYSGAELRACLDYLDRYDASDSTKQPAKSITIYPRTSIRAVRAVC